MAKRANSGAKASKKPVAKTKLTKSAAKKPTAKKPVAKKPVAKKPVAKKVVAKKPVAKKVVAKKVVAKKIVAKKSPVKKSAAKKPAPLRKATKADRDLEKAYTQKQFVAKLRRLADSIEKGRNFQIQVAGEKIHVPDAAIFNIEHEREKGAEELEFQVKWKKAA